MGTEPNSFSKSNQDTPIFLFLLRAPFRHDLSKKVCSKQPLYGSKPFCIHGPVGDSPGNGCCVDLVDHVLQVNRSPVPQIFFISFVLVSQDCGAHLPAWRHSRNFPTDIHDNGQQLAFGIQPLPVSIGGSIQSRHQIRGSHPSCLVYRKRDI